MPETKNMFDANFVSNSSLLPSVRASLVSPSLHQRADEVLHELHLGDGDVASAPGGLGIGLPSGLHSFLVAAHPSVRPSLRRSCDD